MRGSWSVIVLILPVVCFSGKGAYAQEPGAELTPAERQRLEKEADQLDQEMRDLHERGRYPEATEKARQCLKLCRRLYPKEQFPDGHPRLSNSLNGLGLLLWTQGDLDG